MAGLSFDLVSAPRHILLNGVAATPERQTIVVVGASKAADAGLIAVLRQARLLGAGRDIRSVVYAEAASLTGKRALRRFTAPRLIVVSPDPVALAETFGAAERDPTTGVRRARKRIGLIYRVVLRADCPVLVLSHGLACGPLPALAAVVAPFCGVDVPSDDALADEVLSDPPRTQEAMSGFVRLRLAPDRPGDRARTIVIGGPPRSGTSMVAAVLHAAGLPLGDNLVPSTFENAVHNILFKLSVPESWKGLLEKSWKAAFANPRHFRLAWHGFDVTGIEALIATRRQDGQVWGFKRPGIGSFLRFGGLRLLESPRLIFSLRDPVGAAGRIARAHDVEAKVALRIASWFLLDSLETACVCSVPTLLVSHEKATSDPPGLIEQILSFCGLEVEAARRAGFGASVASAGETYRKDFAKPLIGEIMGVVDNSVLGWAVYGQSAPATIDVFADDRKIASGVADEISDDDQFLFKIPLSPDDVSSTSCIRAVFSSSQAELRNSGLTVAELRRRWGGTTQIGSLVGRR